MGLFFILVNLLSYLSSVGKINELLSLKSGEISLSYLLELLKLLMLSIKNNYYLLNNTKTQSQFESNTGGEACQNNHVL